MTGQSPRVSGNRVIDLTLPCDESVLPCPGEAGFSAQATATIAGKGWNSRRIALGSHFSTHVDAPLHMLAGGRSLDRYPPERFIGAARVVDVRALARIGPTDLPGKIDEPFVLLRTGWSDRRCAADYFTVFPELTVAGAQFLLDCGVTLVGIDSFTIDGPPYEAHRLLMAAGALIVENLTGLGELPPRCRLTVAPLKLSDADGAPARVLAEVEV